jgi:HEAT repeat protein
VKRNTALVLVIGLMVGAARSPAQDELQQRVRALSGQIPTTQRTEDELTAEYARVLDALLPGMAAEAIPEREKPQQDFERICFHAGRPGAEVERRVLCIVMTARLGADTPKAARVWLLRQLERMAGPESVTPVARLLDDPDTEIRDLARRVLLNDPDPGAAQALRTALTHAQEPGWQVALINALAARGDEASAPQLAEFVRAADLTVARAAIAALGDIGGPAAVATLPRCWSDAPAALRQPVAEALLRVADRLLQRGDIEGAASIYDDLFSSAESTPVRIAGLHGFVAARGEESVPVLLGVMADEASDGELRAAAADQLTTFVGAPVLEILKVMFAEVSATTQVFILRVLEQGAPAAAPEVAAAAVAIAEAAVLGGEADVRLAGLNALAVLGDERSATLIARAAARATTDVERDAARRALGRLRGEAVDKALLLGLREAAPDARVELIRALAARRYTPAVPALLEQARSPELEVSVAALEALAQLGHEPVAPALVKILLSAEADEVREAAENAVVAVGQRIADPQQRAAAALNAWEKALTGQRVLLLRVLGRLGGSAALGQVRAALASGDPDVVDAAVRALASWTSPEVLDDLLDIARHSADATHRVLALQGYIRLLEASSDRTPDATLALYETAFALAERPEEKKQVLGGLAKVHDLRALTLLQRHVTDETLRAEAEAGIVASARRLGPWEPDAALAALEALIAQAASDKTRQDAQKAGEYIRDVVGRIVTWQIAGPYCEPGKDWAWLHEHAFPPEISDTAEGVVWRALPPTNDLWPWVFDLTKTDEGTDRCVYLRAAVWSERACDARLEIGSDDSAKVWLNDRLVYEFSGRRAHEALREKAPLHLPAGWSRLLVKVVQSDGPWAISCAIRDPDGKPLEGLRVQSELPASTSSPTN